MDARKVTRPPRLAETLLRRLVRPGTAGLSILGDLAEEHIERATRSPRRAAVWYWRQALGIAVRYALTTRPHPRPRKPPMFDLSSDLKSALRNLLKSPGTSSLIAATLGVAIAATTIGFSFADFAVLRGMPVDDASRVVIVHGIDPRQANERSRMSLPNVHALRQRSQTLERVAAFAAGRATLIDRGHAVSIDVGRTTADFFAAMGQRAAAGRTFQHGDDRPGGERMAVLAHRYWQEVHGGDPHVVGRTLLIGGHPHTVVGVASPELEIGSLGVVDVWIAIPFDESGPRAERVYSVVARLHDGKSIETARAELDTISAALARDYPEANDGWRFRPLMIQDAFGGASFWLVIALFGLAATLVMAIASANVANLVLVRATARSREMAVRTALGASRLRLARQLFFEGLLVSAIGGALGLPLAELGLRAIRAFEAEPALQQLRLDGHELIFVTSLVLVGPLLFSFAPALVSLGANLQTVLQAGHARAIGSGGRARAVLVTVQLALASMLLVAAGLAVRSVFNLAAEPIGVHLDGVLTFSLALDQDEYPSTAEAHVTRNAILDRIAALPGVSAAHAIETLPVIEDGRTVSIGLGDDRDLREISRPWAVLGGVDHRALASLRVPLLTGRWLTADEVRAEAPVVLIGRETADRYYGSVEAAVGRTVTIADREQPYPVQIVGVVGDVLLRDLERGPQPRVWAALGGARRFADLVTAVGAPEELAPMIRRAVTEIAPMVPVERLESYRTAFARMRESDYVIIAIFSGFAILALVLAALGLYGVVSYTVSQRTAEFGTRLAVGAQTTDLVLLVLRQTARLVSVGLATGLALGLMLSQAMRSALYGVSPTDAANLALVFATLAVVALMASIVPALRASRVDVIRALRAE